MYSKNAENVSIASLSEPEITAVSGSSNYFEAINAGRDCAYTLNQDPDIGGGWYFSDSGLSYDSDEDWTYYIDESNKVVYLGKEC